MVIDRKPLFKLFYDIVLRPATLVLSALRVSKFLKMGKECRECSPFEPVLAFCSLMRQCLHPLVHFLSDKAAGAFSCCLLTALPMKVMERVAHLGEKNSSPSGALTQ